MAGTDLSKSLLARPGPAIILVRPQLGENIGAAARAMKNFALGELRLVAPRDGWPNEKAYAMSSRSDEILDAATLHEDVPAAIADLNAVYVTTARHRDMDKPVMAPRQAAEEIAGKIAGGQRVGILYGPERAGLENDDIVLGNAIIQVPTNPGYASLNLAQAVLLQAYEYFLADPPAGLAGAPERLPATGEQLLFFFERMEAALDESGFLKPEEKRPTMVRNIRNIFQRADLSEQELRTLHGVLTALVDGRKARRERNKA